MIKILISDRYETVYYVINGEWKFHSRYGFLGAGFIGNQIKEFENTFNVVLEFEE
jgi:hypothetical protein